MEEKDIIKALDIYFNRESPPKFVNVSRVPLICQNINTIYKDIGEIKESVKIKEDDHEQRIRDLEKKGWIATGMAGIIGGIVTWLGQLFISRG